MTYSSTWRYPVDAWQWAKGTIQSQGNLVKDEEGRLVRECMNLIVTITEPLKGFPIPQSGWNLPALDRYAEQLLSGENPSKFSYVYGERLTKYPDSMEDQAYLKQFGVIDNYTDQIDMVITRLKLSQNTRRAIAITWIPGWDTSQNEVPCLQLLDFLIRDGKLHCTTLFRSWDCERAAPANMYGLAKLMQRISGVVGFPVGNLTVVATSAHVYEP